MVEQETAEGAGRSSHLEPSGVTWNNLIPVVPGTTGAFWTLKLGFALISDLSSGHTASHVPLARWT